MSKLLCELGFSLAFEKGEWQQRSQSRGPHWLQTGFGLSSAMMQITALNHITRSASLLSDAGKKGKPKSNPAKISEYHYLSRRESRGKVEAFRLCAQ